MLRFVLWEWGGPGLEGPQKVLPRHTSPFSWIKHGCAGKVFALAITLLRHVISSSINDQTLLVTGVVVMEMLGVPCEF